MRMAIMHFAMMLHISHVSVKSHQFVPMDGKPDSAARRGSPLSISRIRLRRNLFLPSTLQFRISAYSNLDINTAFPLSRIYRPRHCPRTSPRNPLSAVAFPSEWPIRTVPLSTAALSDLIGCSQNKFRVGAASGLVRRPSVP